jgi:hypothetical protein
MRVTQQEVIENRFVFRIELGHFVLLYAITGMALTCRFFGQVVSLVGTSRSVPFNLS